MLEKNILLRAYERIKDHINITPIIQSDYLNQLLGHQIYFKAENLQVSGSFKVRGVLNTILSIQEKAILPKKFVAYSSGNHAHALAWAKSHFNNSFEVEIYMQSDIPLIKQRAVEKYGAKLILTEKRQEAESRAREEGAKESNYFLHPSDNDLVIAGASSLAIEALEQLEHVDSVFAAIGGGALISGCYLGSYHNSSGPLVFGAEPLIANDAAISYRTGNIFKFQESPRTIADGVRSLGVSERTFNYIKKLDDIYEIEEENIIYWTAWLDHLLNISCEPTSSLAMAAAFEWLKSQTSPKKVLIMISGGNVDQDTIRKTWKEDHLAKEPRL